MALSSSGKEIFNTSRRVPLREIPSTLHCRARIVRLLSVNSSRLTPKSTKMGRHVRRNYALHSSRADRQSAEFRLLPSSTVLLMYSGRMTEQEAATHNLIAEFMSVSTQLERYLQEGKSLTTLQLESLSLTVSGLHTFLDSWKRKHGQKSKNPPM
jgi:hypothetical protein